MQQANRLLAALPTADLQRWSHHLELVDMPVGQVLCESGRGFSHMHFPTTSVVSLLNLTASGACAEVATIGVEPIALGVTVAAISLSSSVNAEMPVPDCVWILFQLIPGPQRSAGNQLSSPTT